jgi:hypothetical protein
MNWKVIIASFSGFASLLFPQNLIGCADSSDYYNYYTSFFSKGTSGTPEYEPFYYTALSDFYYDVWNKERPQSKPDEVIREWALRSKAPETDVATVVYMMEKADVEKMLSAKGTVPSALPANLRSNAMVKYLSSPKSTDDLLYLVFAKGVEPYTTEQEWESPVTKDSLKMNGFISIADRRYQTTTDPFLKNKYAFQRCKLAFYNNRFRDCIRWYDEHFTPQNTSAVRNLALSYKAGSLFRSGRSKEAAYIFSKLFDPSAPSERYMLNFLWATEFSNPALEDEYSSMAGSDKEKAKILGMFALYGTDYRLSTIEKVFALDPSSPMLPVLASREINKVEERYLQIIPDTTGRTGASEEEDDKTNHRQYAGKLARFFEKLSAHKATSEPALYLSGAAHLSFILKDYDKAKEYLAQAAKRTPSSRVSEQLRMTQLLVTANRKERIDESVEQDILPAVQWLSAKAKTDGEYATFYGRFFREVMAARYEQQGDLPRAALAHSISDLIEDPSTYGSYWRTASDILQEQMNTEQLLTLYRLYGKSNATGFEKYLLSNASFKRDDVVDVLGTSYLRDHKFAEAIEWLKKASKPKELVVTNYDYRTDKQTTVIVDPFFDYLNDWQRFDRKGTKPYTKLSLAEKLLETQKKLDTTKNVEHRSKLNYLMGTALYNMSYYGNSWEAVAYNRSGIAWVENAYDNRSEGGWEKEYYGVYKARSHYQKAYELTKDKEFKAAAYFMVIKCNQRQIPVGSFEYVDPKDYGKEEKEYLSSPLFPSFVKEFGTTKFYKYTYNRCSYLRDFVARQQRSGIRK